MSFAQNNPFQIKSPKMDFNLSPNGLYIAQPSASVFFPTSSLNPIISNSGIWYSGRMPDNKVRASINLDNSLSDFTFGPLSMSQSENLDSVKWFKTWVITKSEIQTHLNKYKEPGYSVPDNIKNWPVNPPPNYDGILTPFADWNGNGLYEPELGEAPVVEGDLNVFAVYNDYRSNRIRLDSGLGVEIKHFAYIIFNPEINQFLILNRVLLTNRNNFDIHSFKLGLYAELLLGEGTSNFIKSFPKQNAITGYNMNVSDSFYGNHIPAVAFISLNRDLAGTMYLSHDNNPITGYPESVEQINNYLSGKWKNGKSLTYGGNGIDGSTLTRFVYPGGGDPDNHQFEWVEENSGSTPGKRSALIVFDSILFKQNSTEEFRFAYQIIPDVNNDTTLIKEHIIQTQTLYGNGELTNIFDIHNAKQRIQIYPNPISFNSEVFVQSEYSILSLLIRDLTGRIVFSSHYNDQSRKKLIGINPKLKKGIYLIQLTTSYGLTHAKLLVN
ncbi:MAG: T9SS type A sorting domain-containing protein [Bacteroidetes bacterium]|nr:T9SS type A sorting domain-containing protein [Bacteroidota bacterium]